MSALCLSTPHIKLQEKKNIDTNIILNNIDNSTQVTSKSNLEKLEDLYNHHYITIQNNQVDVNNLKNLASLESFNGLSTDMNLLNNWGIDFSMQKSANASISKNENNTEENKFNAHLHINRNKSNNLSSINNSTNINNIGNDKISLIDDNKNEDKNNTVNTIANNLSYKTSLLDIYKLDKNKEKINKLTNYISSNYKVPETEAKEIVSSTYQQSLDKGVDPLLVLSLIEVESAFNKNIKSKYGAIGLTQVMPKSHPEEVAESKNISKNIADVKANIFVGVNVLKKYLTLQKGNVALALQAYNGSLKDKSRKYYRKIVAKQAKLIQVAST